MEVNGGGMRIPELNSDGSIPAVSSDGDGTVRIGLPTGDGGRAAVAPYRLENMRYLKAQCLRQLTGEWRESTLDLDYCVAEQEFKIRSETVPADLSSMNSGSIHAYKLSESLARGDCETYLQYTGTGPRLHFRREHWTIGGSVHDSAIELAPYLRHAPDGVLEYVYPFYQDNFPGWLRTVGEVAKIINDAMEQSNKSGFEKAFEKALEKWQEWLNDDKNKVEPDIKAFMKGTYVDNGKLVRRGT